MTWLRKMRPVILALGLALGVGALIGARSLTHGSGGADAAAKTAEAAHRATGGPVVLGLVDTDPPPVDYRLPPVLPSGTVVKVHVKDGDEVKADQPLYEFDATIQEQDVKRAKAAVAYADTKVKEAEELAKQHAENVKVADQSVQASERKMELTRAFYKLVEKDVETFFRTEKIPEADWPERKKSNATLYKANVDYDTTVNELNLTKAKRDQLKTANPQVKVDEAKAAVEQAKAELAKAQSAVDLCVVKAKAPGTIEQVTISPGTTMGVGTRAPALWLIPAGPRVVRAEVEAEFAHRVGPEIVGKTVTISDHTDPKLTYSGTVRRVPLVFMLKRASAENFLGGDTRVIEAVIEVTDPAPAGRPPLRIGQRVRVNLGQ
jgi:multidrug resistance efflux pump